MFLWTDGRKKWIDSTMQAETQIASLAEIQRVQSQVQSHVARGMVFWLSGNAPAAEIELKAIAELIEIPFDALIVRKDQPEAIPLFERLKLISDRDARIKGRKRIHDELIASTRGDLPALCNPWETPEYIREAQATKARQRATLDKARAKFSVPAEMEKVRGGVVAAPPAPLSRKKRKALRSVFAGME